MTTGPITITQRRDQVFLQGNILANSALETITGVFLTLTTISLGNGFQGDNPNDFKFVFGGGVYRMPKPNENHYLAYGSLWVHSAGGR